MSRFAWVLSAILLAYQVADCGAFSTYPASSGKFSQVARDSIVGTARTRLWSSTDEVESLLQKAREMREQIAVMEGKSVEEVESEARDKKQAVIENEKRSADARAAAMAEFSERRRSDGSFLNVPETQEDQVYQAKQTVEKAYKDGINKQIVRFALLQEDEALNEDRQWPGGAQQMYRRAAGPMTRELLRQVQTDEQSTISRPKVESEDIWDFDGSAMVTATPENENNARVQAMVLPNTDNKYTMDIKECTKNLQGIFVLVNPFWRDVESWGFNLLAPKAKQNAQEVIFDGGFQETYVLLQKSVQGEDCIALKAYPYDWQMYAYAETDYYPYSEYLVHLGSTEEEPKGSDFAAALESFEEFKLSKNMRMMQRAIRKD